MITYGDGKVLFDGSAKGFEIRYKGVITITESPDNLFISANRRKIVGAMLDATDMPQELFSYEGTFRIVSCKSVQDNMLKREHITIQGVDYWYLDNEKWEDDNSLWGEDGGTFTSGVSQRYSKHGIAVNNNIMVKSNEEYQYQDGTPVAENTLIHIHSDGTAMSGGVHTEDSVQIYPKAKLSMQQLNTTIQQIRQATALDSGSGGY